MTFPNWEATPIRSSTATVLCSAERPLRAGRERKGTKKDNWRSPMRAMMNPWFFKEYSRPIRLAEESFLESS
jgi:hypothetical protein